MLQRILSIVLTGFLLLPAPAWSWGNEGHRLVGDVAEEALKSTPNVMKNIRAIFGAQVELHDVATCADRIREAVDHNHPKPLSGVCKTLVDVFADDQRLQKDFLHADKWHFINIPFDGHHHSMKDVKTFCPQPVSCGPDRIDFYTAALKNNDPKVQAEAILFLTHLVGDIHQPLHSADRNHDAGGNAVTVTVFGGQFPLHHVWDDEIIVRMKDASGKPLADEAARSAFLKTSLPAPGNKTPWDWALDAFQLATTVAYVDNHAVIPPGGATLHDVTYLAAADPVTQKQLRLAGVRLASILRSGLNH